MDCTVVLATPADQVGCGSRSLRDAIRETPDLTLNELKAKLGTSLGPSTLCHALQVLRLTFKKVLRGSEQQRPDVAERRALWKLWRLSVAPERLVFLDETWGKTNMFRPRDQQRTDFVLVQACQLLGLLEAYFDGPAATSDLDDLFQ